MGGDAVPWNDPADIAAPAPASDKNVLTAQLKKAVEKPPINKKSVQKIAGARRS
jgi:hypothetical protein